MTTFTNISKDFSHTDHLGSTSYVTNLLGEVSQHMEYFAFGATERKSHAVFLESWERRSFVEEHRSSNNSPYKFNDYGGRNFEKVFDEHTAQSAELDEEIEERDSPIPIKINNEIQNGYSTIEVE